MEQLAPLTFGDIPQEQEKKMAHEEWDRLFNQENGFEEETLGPSITETPMKPAKSKKTPPGGRLTIPGFTMLLSWRMSLPRPDFRIAPWRRRL